MTRGFLRLSLITSEILLLINLKRSSLLREILYFTLKNDLTNGVIQIGSLVDILTYFIGIHLSTRQIRGHMTTAHQFEPGK